MLRVRVAIWEALTILYYFVYTYETFMYFVVFERRLWCILLTKWIWSNHNDQRMIDNVEFFIRTCLNFRHHKKKKHVWIKLPKWSILLTIFQEFKYCSWCPCFYHTLANTNLDFWHPSLDMMFYLSKNDFFFFEQVLKMICYINNYFIFTFW